MKYVKMLGLAAMAAMALMAFTAGTASATKLCTTSNCSSDLAAGSEIVASLTGGTATLESTGGTVLDTCTGGSVSGTTNATSGSPLTGENKSLTWSGCTKTTDTLNPGSLSIEYTEGNNGEVKATGAEVTVNTIFGTCVYGSGATLPLGTLNGGATATLEIKAVVPKISGNGLCPGDAVWNANYVVTTPASLYVAP